MHLHDVSNSVAFFLFISWQISSSTYTDMFFWHANTYYHSLPYQHHTCKMEIFKVLLTNALMWTSLHMEQKKKEKSILFVVSIVENKRHKKKKKHFSQLRATCSCSAAQSSEDRAEQVHLHSLSSSTAAATSIQWGINRVVLAANYCTSPPPFFPFPLHICILTFSAHFAFCSEHRRVNLLILQAPSLFYLSFFLCFFPSFSPSLRQGCAVRPFQSSGVVRSDGWLSTFCCLALRSWEIYRLADYQAWKPISLSHSSLASSIHTCLAPSISLFYFNIFSITKKKKLS